MTEDDYVDITYKIDESNGVHVLYCTDEEDKYEGAVFLPNKDTVKSVKEMLSEYLEKIDEDTN